MAEKETKSCSDCIHFDVCYKIEHFGRDLEDTSPCEQFISKDVEPVKHGHWESFDTTFYAGTDEFGEPKQRNGKIFYCHNSDCRYRSIIKTNYCPNCGAKNGRG